MLKLKTFLIILLVTIPFTVQANENQINNIIKQYRAKNQLSGTILVAKDKHILVQNVFGLANQKLGYKNKIDTQFLIGSISKQFTAVAILLLAEQGKLNLSDKVNKYLPNLPSWSDEVTIHHLLTHSSGLPDYINLSNFLTKYHTPYELIEAKGQQDIKFKPGEAFFYSNINYVILGRIIEKVSGLKLEDYIERNLLIRAGLNSTFLVHKNTVESLNQQREKKIALGYRFDPKNKTFLHVPSIDLSNGFGAGSVISTVNDLYKWNQALYSNKIISSDSMKKFLFSYFYHEKYESDYGYGIEIMQLSNGQECYYHAGRWRGFTGILLYIPRTKITIVILTNQTDENMVPQIVSLAKKIGQIKDL
jgi:CubicO group peptidase (beta-lactamase class C family)